MLATYKQITDYIKKEYGYTAQGCWIAHMKEICGLKPRVSPNRHSINFRVKPCPLNKQHDILAAFKHFKMI